MTDKQIIIDDQKNTIYRLQQECTEKSNVIIALGEQLKAKEQECEELKSDLTDLSKIIDCKNGTILTFKEQLDQLKSEIEELKQEKRNFYNFLTNKYNYGSFRPMWGTYLLRRFFKEDLGDFFDEKSYEMADTIEDKEKQLNKYSQTLTEIKKIAEQISLPMGTGKSNNISILANQILQKINECEVENE